MPKLSICIPTYNRTSELKSLNDRFLKPALDRFSDLIEVLVFDNSDVDQSETNRNNLDSRVIYRKNDANIGFSRNVINCFEGATGKYVWLLPDNDDIELDGFSELMRVIGEGELDCIMVPYSSKNLLGDDLIANFSSLNFELGAIDALRASGGVPFVLLSCVVVKRRPNPEEKEALSRFSNSAFIQVPLIMSQLCPTSKIGRVNRVVVKYNVEYHGRFSPWGTYNDIVQVIDYLGEKYEFRVASLKELEYRQCLWLIVSESTGIYKVFDYDVAKRSAIAEIRSYMSVKTFVVFSVLLLPKAVQSAVWRLRVARAYGRHQTAGGVLSFLRNVFRNYSVLRGLR